VSKKPPHQASWDVDAWYAGTALQHYLCHTVWVWTTRHKQITDTVTWVSRTGPIPLPTIEEMIQATSKTLLGLLCNQPANLKLTHSKTIIELSDQLGQPLPHMQTLTPTVKPTQEPISTPTTLPPVERASPHIDPLPRVAIPIVAPTNQPPQVLNHYTKYTTSKSGCSNYYTNS
jgi:hypothetical protein